MSADLRPDRCETCCHWTREPTLATGIRRPIGSNLDLGCCHFYPPTIVVTALGGKAIFPEIHAHRFCRNWMTDREPGGDGGEKAPADNVVRLRGAA